MISAPSTKARWPSLALALVALVWHKSISTFFEIVPFGEYRATEVEEEEDRLAVTLTQEVPNGTTLRFRYRFARGSSLVAIEATLDDGSKLAIRAREQVTAGCARSPRTPARAGRRARRRRSGLPLTRG